jgi:hypothetical protein
LLVEGPGIPSLSDFIRNPPKVLMTSSSFSFSSSAEGADGVCTDLNALFTSATLPLHHVCTAMKPSPSKPHGEF